MKRHTITRAVSLLLTLVLCLGLAAPALASAAPPDWYFLFAIFKQVDANCDDGKGKTTHTKYTMPQEEVDAAREYAKEFEAFMNQVGVMRAHVDVVEIDTPVKKLAGSDYGSWIDAEQADILLKGKVDRDRYDHVFCFITLNVSTVYMGLTGGPLENGTGETCVNFALARKYINPDFTPAVCVHEFLHFMEQLDEKWGASYDLHNIGDAYGLSQDDGKACYTDIILNRVKKGTKFGTGVIPAAWQYPPRTLRTMQELTVPSGITGIGTWAFGNYTSLTRVFLPASVTSIGYAAFWNTGLKEVYYGGSEAQWKRISMGEFNGALTGAAIHYNSTGLGASRPSGTSSAGAVLSPQKLSVDGRNINCEKYNIGGSNYFKLRDLAQLLNGTGSQFGVGFDSATSTVTITTGASYTSTGTELKTGVDNSSTAQLSSQSIRINGAVHGELTVYNIGGSNFFQLRELGNLLDFEVGYDTATNTATVRSTQK